MSRIRIGRKLPGYKFPLHYTGAPQRRIFIPEWYVTLVKPRKEMPKNYVRFHVPADMTKYDMKEYLDKVYKIPVMSISLSIVNYIRYRQPTPWRKDQYMWKFLEPWKIAHVYLGNNETFEFPEILTKIKDEDDEEMEGMDSKTMVEQQEAYSKFAEKQQTTGTSIKDKTYFENKWL
ncbi:large ribosomal subunit protein uL23m-like [Ciona intestinalis]